MRYFVHVKPISPPSHSAITLNCIYNHTPVITSSGSISHSFDAKRHGKIKRLLSEECSWVHNKAQVIGKMPKLIKRDIYQPTHHELFSQIEAAEFRGLQQQEFPKTQLTTRANWHQEVGEEGISSYRKA